MASNNVFFLCLAFLVNTMFIHAVAFVSSANHGIRLGFGSQKFSKPAATEDSFVEGIVFALSQDNIEVV